MANKYAITGIAMNWSVSTWGQIVTGADWTSKVLTPATPTWPPSTDLTGKYIEIRTTTAVLCTIASNTDTTITTVEAGPANSASARYVLFNEAKPAGGDVASANGAVVTMDETPIPASGTVELDSWDTAATPVRNAGQFSIVMTDAIHHDPGSAINTSNLIAGSLSGGLIKTSGAGPADHICTMTADYSIGGIADTRFCFHMTHSGGTFWLKNCDVWAGVGGNRATGFSNITTGTGIVKLTNVNFHNQITGMAYEGRAPVWELGDKSDYMDWYRGSGPIAVPNTKHGPEPAAGEMLLGVVCGSTTGTVWLPGTASGSATLAKETGAKARGSTGTCAKLTPTSTSAYGYWDFYVPATADTEFTLSFYWAKSAAGFNGLLKVSIWDTDGTTLKNTSESVDITAADTNYHQFSATPVTPTDTGLCRVRLEIKDGASTGLLYLDDIAVA